jgi:hypothetical protein
MIVGESRISEFEDNPPMTTTAKIRRAVLPRQESKQSMRSSGSGNRRATREFKRCAEAGMLGVVNVGVTAPMAFFPFIGWKSSFFGDLFATGIDAVRFYTRQKVVMSGWWELPKSVHERSDEGAIGT